MLADANYTLIAIMILIAVGTAAVILLLTHVVLPWLLRHTRYDEYKHGTYESGVDPVGDTRKRFNVRFYLIAVLFLIFDVEIVFLYPFGQLFVHTARGPQALPEGDPTAANQVQVANTMLANGYDVPFLLLGVGFFTLLLLVGLVYEWRKGLFKWA